MATQQELLDQLVQLTSAVKSMAEQNSRDHRDRDAVSDADRVRHRVAFGYQALGALTGRVSSGSGREFEVRVLRARRSPGVVYLEGLPDGADWVELRRGSKVELLRVRGDQEHVDNPQFEASDDSATSSRKDRDRGAVFPRLFTDQEEIGSIVALRARRGPLVAFGPRLRAMPASTDRHSA